MAAIEARVGKDGKVTFRVQIRKKGAEIYRTFPTEEDAKLFVFYKENLIVNMENFKVSQKERLTLKNIIELKQNTVLKDNRKARLEFVLSFEKVSQFIKKTFYDEITYDDWVKVITELLKTHTYKGAKTEVGKRETSLGSVRRYLANISSAVSYVQSLGVAIENHVLRAIQTHINPTIKKSKGVVELK